MSADTRDRLRRLLQDKAVLHGDFVLASGQKSKVFFDCKRVTLDPEGLHLIATLVLETLDELAARDGRPIDAIGGPTIGADPVVGHVAGRSWERSVGGWTGARSSGEWRPAAVGSPPHPIRAFLVRREIKDHGTRRLIENDIPAGARVVIFEDVITTGASTLDAVRKAEESGLEVAAVIALVDREQGGAEALKKYRYIAYFRKGEFGL